MVVTITQTIYPKKRSAWRNWLLKNHDKRSEIWVIYFKKFTGKPTLLYQDAVDEALCFGWIDGVEKSLDKQRYAQRFTPRTKKSNWTEGNIKRYEMLAKMGLVTKKGEETFKNRKV